MDPFTLGCPCDAILASSVPCQAHGHDHSIPMAVEDSHLMVIMQSLSFLLKSLARNQVALAHFLFMIISSLLFSCVLHPQHADVSVALLWADADTLPFHDYQSPALHGGTPCPDLAVVGRAAAGPRVDPDEGGHPRLP